MDQVKLSVALNLHEFAGYMKKSLILTLIIVFGGLFTFIGLIFLGSPDFYLVVGCFLSVAGVLVVFQVLGLIRLSRAKDASSDPHLTRSFQKLLVAVIAGWVSIVFTPILFIPASLLGLIFLGCRFWGYKDLVEFAEGHFPSPEKVREGFHLYSNANFIGYGLSWFSLVQLFLSDRVPLLLPSFGIAVFLLGIGLIALVAAIVGLYKLANGFLDLCSREISLRTPLPPQTEDLYENEPDAIRSEGNHQ